MALPVASSENKPRIEILKQWIDPIARVGAVIVAMTYIVGFVIVTLHHRSLALLMLAC